MKGYIATVPELPGCSAFGDTEEEAIKEVKVAASLWLTAAKKAKRPIPEPIVEKTFKARFPLRIPQNSHMVIHFHPITQAHLRE